MTYLLAPNCPASLQNIGLAGFPNKMYGYLCVEKARSLEKLNKIHGYLCVEKAGYGDMHLDAEGP
jgi:hypothetical protein